MSSQEITQVLFRMRSEGRAAIDDLFQLVYKKLRAIAARQIAGSGPNPTLDTVGLVNEAYLKLVDQNRAEWQDRRHFFSVAAMAMRQIVVDRARRRLADKRGGRLRHKTLDETRIRLDERADEILAIDEALEKLAARNERLRKVVELRFFGGLSVEETAGVLELTERTIRRDWREAKAFLQAELRHSDRAGRPSPGAAPAGEPSSE